MFQNTEVIREICEERGNARDEEHADLRKLIDFGTCVKLGLWESISWPYIMFFPLIFPALFQHGVIQKGEWFT